MSIETDVVILGGGPAACTALSLRHHEPALSVLVVERSSYREPRIGETLPPPARMLLEHLDVWGAFQDLAHLEVHGTAASWGSFEIHENPYLFGTVGTGWHLDRVRFDAMLATQAERRGIEFARGTQVRSGTQVDRDGGSGSPMAGKS